MSRIVIFTALCVSMVAIGNLGFAQEKHKMSEVMKKGFKADNGPFKNAVAGKASADDLKLLKSYITTMVAYKPKRGDAGSWREKTSALVAATKALASGDKSAAATLKKAGDCKACHKAHKPKKKK